MTPLQNYIETRLIGLPQPVFSGDISTIGSCPNRGGVYLLAIQLDHHLSVAKPKPADLTAVTYLYAGSARGPGGLRARLARHLKAVKTIRWHVDQLTTQAAQMRAWGWSNGSECALIFHLEKKQGLHHAMPGFGSSDCSACRSHLLFLRILCASPNR